MHTERLDKLLAGSGQFTRSEARAAVLAGRVTVDGKPAQKPDIKVSRDSLVTADGAAVDTAEFVYYMLHKPADCVSAVTDERWPTVIGLFPEDLRRRGISPAGRLDADVTGLLIITDDGGYVHRVTSPRSQVKKVYEARTDGPLSPADAKALAAGVTLPDGTRYRPALLEPNSEDDRLYRVTVTEGKFHEVKNLFEARGRRVLTLRRLSIGGLLLDEGLAPGCFRRMTPTEAATALL